MTVRPIRDDGDYRQALARLETLMGALPGTPEADDLEVLSALLERHERRSAPIGLPTPTDAIRFRMEQQGLTPRDLEPLIGSRARVSEVLGGVRPLSIDMIRALNQHLGIPAEVLIQPMESPRAEVEPALSRPASRQLASQGLLGGGETVRQLLLRAFGADPAPAFWRRTRTARTNAKTDPVALQAWCAGAVLLSRRVEVCAPFDAGRLGADAVRALVRLSTEPDGPRRAIEALAGHGVAAVVLSHLPGTHLDGAAMRRPDGVPMVALTLRRDRVDNFWFTLLHELAHVQRHLTVGGDAIFDDLEIGSEDAIEGEADRLAEQALIPDAVWSTFETGPYASMRNVLELAAAAEVHPAVVAGRWQRQNRDFRKFSRLLGHGEVRPCFPTFQSSA